MIFHLLSRPQCSRGTRATLAGMPDDEAARARALVSGARRITVLTGAGISTDSGIPDFRGPQGVWTKNPAAERTATLANYLDDPEVRRQSWQTRLASPAWAARPNAGHLALVELERQGRLRAVVTQNIDELHQRAGHDPDLRPRAARHHVAGPVLVLRRRRADGAGARPGPGRGRRSALRTLRRDPQVGHDQLRPVPRPRGPGPGGGGRCRLRSAAGRGFHPRRLSRRRTGTAGLPERAARSSSSTPSPRPTTIWPRAVVRVPISEVLPVLVAAAD